MTESIYTKFDRSFGNVTAQALLLDGKPVGRIVIKYGNAATAYVQVWGASMATARATGYGYDKGSAAVMEAIRKLPDAPDPADTLASEAQWRLRLVADGWDGGTRYANVIEAAGFTICNVI
jgi:hypothetical protein